MTPADLPITPERTSGFAQTPMHPLERQGNSRYAVSEDLIHKGIMTRTPTSKTFPLHCRSSRRPDLQRDVCHDERKRKACTVVLWYGLSAFAFLLRKMRWRKITTRRRAERGRGGHVPAWLGLAGTAVFEEDAACLMVRRGASEGSRAVDFAAVACEKRRYASRTCGAYSAF